MSNPPEKRLFGVRPGSSAGFLLIYVYLTTVIPVYILGVRVEMLGAPIDAVRSRLKGGI